MVTPVDAVLDDDGRADDGDVDAAVAIAALAAPAPIAPFPTATAAEAVGEFDLAGFLLPKNEEVTLVLLLLLLPCIYKKKYEENFLKHKQNKK